MRSYLFWGELVSETETRAPIYVKDKRDRACACLKSVLRISVDKDHRTIVGLGPCRGCILKPAANMKRSHLYQTCTTIEMNCRQELSMEWRSVFMCNY